MRSLTFDEAWIRDGHKLAHAKLRDVSSSDDDCSYERYLKPNLDAGDPARRRYHPILDDVDPQRRSSVRAATKGMAVHSETKGNLVTFAGQHSNTVNSMLGGISSPRGILSAAASKSGRSISSVTPPSGRLRAASGSAGSCSSDDDDNNRSSSRSHHYDPNECGTSINWRQPSRRAATSAAGGSGRAATPRSSCYPRRSGGGGGRDKAAAAGCCAGDAETCSCRACSSRADRITATAAACAELRSGRSGSAYAGAKRPQSTGEPSSAGSTRPAAAAAAARDQDHSCRQLLRALLLTQIDPSAIKSIAATAATAAVSSVSTKDRSVAGYRRLPRAATAAATDPRPPMPQPLSFTEMRRRSSGGGTGAGGRSSQTPSESATPRVTWHSYLSSGGPAAAAADSYGSNSRTCNSRVHDDRIRSTCCRSRGGGAAAAAVHVAAAGLAQRQVALRSRAGGDADGDSVSNWSISISSTDTAASGGSKPGASGGPAGRRDLADDFDIDSDDSDEHELQEIGDQLTGAAAARRQMPLRQAKQDLATLCRDSWRRARTAVLRGSGGSSDGAGAASDAPSRRSGSGSAGRAAAVDGLDPLASFTSWVSRKDAVLRAAAVAAGYRTPAVAAASRAESKTRSGSEFRPRGNGGGGGSAHVTFSSPSAAVSFVPPWASLARRQRSMPGGGGGGDTAGSRLWRDAAALVRVDTSRHRSRSAGGGDAGSPLKSSLSEGSEEGFALRVVYAAMASRGNALDADSYDDDHEDDTGSRRSGGAAAMPRRVRGNSTAVRKAPLATAPPRAASVVSDGLSSSKPPRTWFLTDVLRTPVASHVGSHSPATRGSVSRAAGGSPHDVPSSPLSGGSPPWAQSPSQKLSLTRVWGLRRSSDDDGESGGEDYKEGHHHNCRGGGGGDSGGSRGWLRSPRSAVSDDVIWRSPSLSRSPPSSPRDAATATGRAATITAAMMAAAGSQRRTPPQSGAAAAAAATGDMARATAWPGSGSRVKGMGSCGTGNSRRILAF